MLLFSDGRKLVDEDSQLVERSRRKFRSVTVYQDMIDVLVHNQFFIFDDNEMEQYLTLFE